MFESVLNGDARVLNYILLSNGNYSVTIKPEYVNSENVSTFETEPMASSFGDNMYKYANSLV